MLPISAGRTPAVGHQGTVRGYTPKQPSAGENSPLRSFSPEFHARPVAGTCAAGEVIGVLVLSDSDGLEAGLQFAGLSTTYLSFNRANLSYCSELGHTRGGVFSLFSVWAWA